MPYFILKNGLPLEVPNTLTWARWFDTHSPDRIVEQTKIGGVEVSTIFFGLDPSPHNTPPRLYRTTTTTPDDIKAIYATLEEAREGHQKVCEQLKTPC